MLYARIPSDRLGVLIGPEGATKRRLQESTGTRIAVDSATGDVTIDETAAADPVLALKARDVVQAMARGFSEDRAFRLLDDECYLEILYQRLRALQESGRPGPGAAHRHPGEDATNHRRADRRGGQRLRAHGRDDRGCLRDGDRPRGGFHAPQGERAQDGIPVPRAEARRPESVSDGFLGLPAKRF